MPRYDIYRISDQKGYLLDVQSDLLDELKTRVVVPLIPVDIAPRLAKCLTPVFTIESAEYVMVTPLMASIPASDLKMRVTNLSDSFDEISNALDMVFHGF